MNRKIRASTIFSLIIIVCILSISIGYSSFHSAMEIDNIKVAVRINRDIRITNAYVENTSNGAISMYDEYDEHALAFNINLPNSTSSVTYKIKVTNFGNVVSGIYDITGLPSNLTYELKDYTLKNKMCNTSGNCSTGMEKEFDLVIKYKYGGFDESKSDYAINLDVDFRPIYTLTLNPNGGNVSPNTKDIMFNDIYGALPTPTKTGHTFGGWYKESSLTTIVNNDTRYDNTSDSTIYAKFTNTPPTQPTMNVSFPSGTTLPSGGTLKATVTLSGSTDAEDGTVTYGVTCSGASNIRKISSTKWELTFNKTGFFPILGMAYDSVGAKAVTTKTHQIKGSSSGTSGSGQFVGTTFDSGWSEIVPNCYLSGFKFFLQIPPGHNSSTDTLVITIKYKDGTTQKIEDFYGNLASTPHSYNSTDSAYSGYFKLNESNINKTPVAIKFVATTPGHASCVPNSTITYDLQYTYDSNI